MSDTVRNTSGGVGFAGLLTLLFIGLKLSGNIDWSWVWVLSPLWLGMAFGALVALTCLVCMGVIVVVQALRKRS